MKRNKLLALPVAICLVAILAMLPFMGACAKPAPTVTKIACTIHLPPPPPPPAIPSAPMQSVVDFASRVNEATQGRVTIENFWGASLGKPDDFIKMVGSPGVADAGFIIATYHKWEIPLNAALLLPFLTSDLDAQSRAFKELYDTWKPFREEWDEANIEVIWVTCSPTYVTGSVNKPIQTLDDIKGMKLWGAGYYADCLSAVGANVASFPAGETYEALVKGVIEGIHFPLSGHHIFRSWEVEKYMTDTSFLGGYGAQVWGINKEVWNQISKDDQQAMKKIGAEIVDEWVLNQMAEHSRIFEMFTEKGIKFYELSAADKAKWVEIAKAPIQDAWMAEMEKRGQGDDAREVLERYKALLEKYEPQSKYSFSIPK